MGSCRVVKVHGIALVMPLLTQASRAVAASLVDWRAVAELTATKAESDAGSMSSGEVTAEEEDDADTGELTAIQLHTLT